MSTKRQPVKRQNLENKKSVEKQLYGYFRQQICEIVNEMTWTWLRRENLKREIEFFFIAAQNNVIRTNYMMMKIDNS